VSDFSAHLRVTEEDVSHSLSPTPTKYTREYEYLIYAILDLKEEGSITQAVLLFTLPLLSLVFHGISQYLEVAVVIVLY